MDVFEEKIKTWQSVGQAEYLFLEFINRIDVDRVLRKEARIRVRNSDYPYKILLDEYRPLLEFAKTFCEDRDIELRYTGDETQTRDLKYDGEIRLRDGTILTIEIAKPFDGWSENIQAQELNKNGYSEDEKSDGFELARSIVQLIRETAINKSEKNYSDTILVFYAKDLNWFRNLDHVIHDWLHDQVIQGLKSIPFKAKEVYLLIPDNSDYSRFYGGELIRIF